MEQLVFTCAPCSTEDTHIPVRRCTGMVRIQSSIRGSRNPRRRTAPTSHVSRHRTRMGSTCNKHHSRRDSCIRTDRSLGMGCRTHTQRSAQDERAPPTRTTWLRALSSAFLPSLSAKLSISWPKSQQYSSSPALQGVASHVMVQPSPTSSPLVSNKVSANSSSSSVVW